MSEYSESHSISRLIGSPPGYIGYEEGGQLTNALLTNPYSIVLLDEIEKAHPKVLKLFLHILDSGFFSSARGKLVDCRKCIFIATSNLASLEISKLHTNRVDQHKMREILKPFFMEALSPELYNRFDVLIFSPLSTEILEKLVLKLLGQLRDRTYQIKKTHLQFDPSLVEHLKSHGMDPELGARPLKRLIDKYLGTIIAKTIIYGNCTKEDTLLCSYSNGYVIVEKVKKAK